MYPEGDDMESKVGAVRKGVVRSHEQPHGSATAQSRNLWGGSQCPLFDWLKCLTALQRVYLNFLRPPSVQRITKASEESGQSTYSDTSLVLIASSALLNFSLLALLSMLQQDISIPNRIWQCQAHGDSLSIC
jgi:hypothetical protein